MFEITSGWIGPFVIVLGVMLRKPILKKLNKEGAVANIVYVASLFALSLPFYLYQFKFTLFTLNEKSAKEMVTQALRYDLLKKYRLTKIETVKPLDKKGSRFFVKAGLVNEQDGRRYSMYLRPECKLLEGCAAGLDDIVIVDENAETTPRAETDLFDPRTCQDEILKEVIIKNFVKPFFKLIFEKYNKIKHSSAYTLDRVAVQDPDRSELKIKNVEDSKNRFNNSCRATLEIEGDFNIDNNEKMTKLILSSMFDRIQRVNGRYKITTKLFYNVYTNDEEGSINANVLFVDIEKMKRIGEKIKNRQAGQTQ